MYVRVLEPAWARALGADVRAFDDLDAHPSLILTPIRVSS
jgi:hypothetical protein